ncbi:MAG: AtpZ/AtpI family protein [Desulfovibrionaceae bacterium]|nr:AtpZ/AtpI family protein [Desulfovibrionaceae bacterium]
MGLHMVTGPAVGAGLGWLADRWLDSWPAGSAIGLLLGVAAGFRNVWMDARYLIRAQESGPKPDEEPGSAPGARPASAPHPGQGRTGGQPHE